jgi:hypothetical protein
LARMEEYRELTSFMASQLRMALSSPRLTGYSRVLG